MSRHLSSGKADLSTCSSSCQRNQAYKKYYSFLAHAESQMIFFATRTEYLNYRFYCINNVNVAAMTNQKTLSQDTRYVRQAGLLDPIKRTPKENYLFRIFVHVYLNDFDKISNIHIVL